MTIALVSHTKVTGANGGTSASIDTTGASLLIFAVSQYHGGTAVTPSDSKSNTWTALTRQFVSTPDVIIYYAKNPTVGAGHTFTATGSSSFSTSNIAAFSGVDTTAPFDVQNGATNGTGVTSLATGSITPSVDNELVIAALCAADNSNTYTINGSFTITDSTNWASGNNEGGALAYLIQTTKTAANPTWSWTASATAAAAIASFKAAAGGTNFSLSVNAGSYAITGSAATLTAARALSVAAGAYVITGSAATVLASRALSATTGAYAITGIDANLAKGRQLSVAAGSYAITGSDASLIAARAMSAASGAYVIVGSSANLAHVIPGTESTQGMGPGWNLFHPEVKRSKRTTADEIEDEIRALLARAENAETPKETRAAVRELKQIVRKIADAPPAEFAPIAPDLAAIANMQMSALALTNAIHELLERRRLEEEDDMEAFRLLAHLA